jgi:hypothetical protein
VRDDQITTYIPVNVENIHCAELEIIRQVQQVASILHTLKVDEHGSSRSARIQRKKLLKKSSVYSRDPFLDSDGIFRVGGRLQKAQLDYGVKHPIILPRTHHVTDMVIGHFHEKMKHQGRGMTTNKIRENGFWIIGCSSAVSHYIRKCVKCRKLRSPVQEQKMADPLLHSRTAESTDLVCGTSKKVERR